MSDYNGFTLKRVHDMIKTYLYRQQKKCHLGQNLAT